MNGYGANVAWKCSTEFANRQKTLTDKYSHAKLDFYVTEEARRNMEPGAIASPMKTNNDLFAYGIEGEDWNAVGDIEANFLNCLLKWHIFS